MTKAKKSKRQFIDKKTNTDLVNSPAGKPAKDTRSALSGLHRETSINRKDSRLQEGPAPKSVNFPSYYKGGSAASGQRQTVGLKEAAIQMIDNRYTKTLEKTRAQNVSPIVTSIKGPNLSLNQQQEQPPYLKKKSQTNKKKESPRSNVFISKTVVNSMAKIDNGIDALESFYREKR